MSDNFYTLLIIPKKKNSAKKVCMSHALLMGISLGLLSLSLALMVLTYDYIHIKRDNVELARLKQKTAEQESRIASLVGKVDGFTSRMEELRQFDRKIRIMANLEGNKYKQQMLGIGGSLREEDRIAAKLSAQDRDLVEGAGKQVDRLMKEAEGQQSSFQELLSYFRERKSILAATPSVWPVHGWVTSEFGQRISPFSNATEFHRGIDIASRVGKTVHAPADALVEEVAYDHGEGNYVKLNHGYGINTYYGHLVKSAVAVGTRVKRGDVIGYVGNSGRSTGSHLHYSIFVNGLPVNPRKYLN